MIETFLIGLAAQVKLKRLPVGSFKPEAYKAILPTIQKHVVQQGSKEEYLQVTVPQLKIKISSFKKLYSF